VKSVLLDQNVPYPVRKLLEADQVKTAYEMGWAKLANGDLLKAAATAGFRLMVTCDQNIRYQQNMVTRNIGLVVLPTNNWNVLRDRATAIRQAVKELPPDGYVYIECGLPLRRHRRPHHP
jgi:hypothetical protein